MPDRERLACGLALVLACALLVPVAAAPPQSLASLAGTWVRDAALSDDPIAAVRERRIHPPLIGPGAPGAPMGGPGMGGPIMSGRPGGGYSRDPDEVERTRALMRLVTNGPDELMISVDGRAVTITTRAGSVTHLTADDKKVLEPSEAGVQLERRTKWDDGALVTKFKVKGGGADGKQVYRPSGARLTLEAVFDGDAAMRTIKVKHVYARKNAG
jgi:hypothetical protein